MIRYRLGRLRAFFLPKWRLTYYHEGIVREERHRWYRSGGDAYHSYLTARALGMRVQLPEKVRR